jgi:hypothetical protein
MDLDPKSGGGEMEFVCQEIARPVLQDQMVAINVLGARVQDFQFVSFKSEFEEVNVGF